MLLEGRLRIVSWILCVLFNLTFLFEAFNGTLDLDMCAASLYVNYLLSKEKK